jgi:serine/threonine protein kinase
MLERKCGGDHALLAEARALLASDIEAGELTKRLTNAIPDAGLAGSAEGEAPGTRHLPAAGDIVGAYTIVRALGSGGSSSVFEAVRPGLDRAVALKVLHQALSSDHDRWRFEHEVRALSRLEHPSVARVIDFGIGRDARPFIVTELVGSDQATGDAGEVGAGGPAVPFAPAARALSIPDRLLMILTLCDAVSHAHQRGVIHRDLKSANVLVATDDDGKRRPVIVDFGIARSFTPAHRHAASASPPLAPTMFTTPGLVIGTVGTMAPEQASGDPDAVDTRTDVWGLGVLLFESLTGELPHGTPGPGPGGMASWLSRVQQAECRRVRSLDPTIAPDLDAIVSKALSSQREGRYVSAAALADDLRRYLAGEPTLARPVTAIERAWKWTRRHKKSVAVGSVLLVMAAAAGTATVRAVNAERREWARAAENYEFLLRRVMDEVRDSPASSATRRLLVANTLQKLERDTVRRPNDARLLAMLARARVAAANLASESGDRTEALRLHEAALADWTRVCTLEPDMGDARLERTTQFIRVMDTTPGLTPEQRLSVIRETHSEFEALAQSSPDLVHATTALCWSHERLAALATELGRIEEAKSHRLMRIALAEPLAERHPEHPDVLYNLAEAYILLADRLDRWDEERLAAIARGIEAGERFHAAFPNDRRSVHSLARAQSMQSWTFRERGEPDKSDGPSLRALDLARGLWDKDRNDSIARWTLQAIAGERAHVQFLKSDDATRDGAKRGGDLEGALQSVDLCLELVARNVDHEGDTRELSRIRSHMMELRARILARLEKTNRAPQPFSTP